VSNRLRAATAIAIVAFAASACTAGAGAGTSDVAAPSATHASGGLRLPAVEPGGAPTLRRAVAKLCEPTSVPSGTPASGELPPELATIAHEVEQARGHDFVTPPSAEAISPAEMDRRLEESFRAYYQKDLYDRRTFAWRTIGVIPPDADLHLAYRAFLTGGVVGFYDPETGELVYEGSGDLGFAERLTLAHELTHALDDQVFDLKRLDAMTSACLDERSAAALGLVEGSAQYFSAAAIAENPDIDLGDLLDAIAAAREAGSPPEGVPPFLYAISTWPYTAGMAFVGTLAGEGGTAAVDRAFEHLPDSTEQVTHPDLYPGDRPAAIDISDVTGELGSAWGDLDAMTIGEEWLRAMLELRLDGGTADAAAAGWNGGGYRAFTDGTDVVVVLRTAWDTAEDAAAFADALGAWGSTDRVTPTVAQGGETVTAVFATSESARDSAAAAFR
jgi:hypothetical protein